MIWRYFLTVGLTIFLAFWAYNSSAEVTSPSPNQDVPQADDLTVTLGNPRADLTLNIYIEMSCHHCADLVKNTLPTIKKEYVDTSKVKFVFHDLVKNGTDLKMASLLSCLSPDHYWQLASLLYTEQDKWKELEDPMVYARKVALLAGMDQEKIDACVNNVEVQKKLAKRTIALAKIYKRLPTPLIIINDTVYKGKMSVDELRKIIDKHMTMKNNHAIDTISPSND